MLRSRAEISQDKCFGPLTAAILERDQPRTADLFFQMVAKEGRPIGDALAVVTAAEAPFVQVPSHINIKDGQVSLINNDHTILGLRAAACLMPYLPEQYRLLPLLQSVWYIPAGLDIWNQLQGKYPGRYATMKGLNVPPPDYGPVVWQDDHKPIREEGSVEERLHGQMIATVSGDARRSYGLFLGIAEDEQLRPALRDQLEFLGLIDLQDTVVGRKARNTGHKAIRARAITDLADVIGWEQAHGVYYMGVPDMAVGPLYYSLYDAVCVRLAAEFPEDAGKSLVHTNKSPLSPAEVEEMVRQLMTADSAAVWDLLTGHLKNGKSIRSLGDTIQLGAAELILRTTVPRQFTNGQHPFDYCNVANNWMRTPRQPVPAADPLSDGQLHQRRGAREQALPLGHRAGMRRLRRRRPPAAGIARRTRRRDHGARFPARHRGCPRLSEIRRGPPRLSGNGGAVRLPLSGRPAQPEDHDLDLRGIRAQFDPSARPAIAGDAATAGRLAQDAGRARLPRPLHARVGRQLNDLPAARLDQSTASCRHSSRRTPF